MWPGLFVESGLISVWAVILGLLIEWPFVRWASAAGWARSLGMTAAINAVSFITGYFINPIVGFFVIIPHDLLGMLIDKSGTFGPSGWIFTYHGIVLATAFVEFMAFRFFYLSFLFLTSYKTTGGKDGLGKLATTKACFCLS